MLRIFAPFVLTIFLASLPVNSALPPATAVGETAPEIELPSMNGNKVKLSSLQGNIVLLSFWSTWCAACNTIKNPEYVRLYNKYKDYNFKNADGFTIYSVAFDSDLPKWKKRITEKGLNWPHHVVDKDSYYSLYWWIYNIQSIPSSFLIDEKGKIIGSNLSYAELDRELSKRKKAKTTPTPTPTPPPGDVTGGSTGGSSSSGGSSTTTGGGSSTTGGGVTVDNGNGGTSKEVEKTVYKIQLGVFRRPSMSSFSNLSSLGELETERATTTLKRVLLGTFDKYQYKTVLASVKAKGYRDAFVVTRKVKQTVIEPDPEIVDGGSSSSKTQTGIVRKIYKIQLGVFRRPNMGAFSRLSGIGSVKTENTSSGLKRVVLGDFENADMASNALGQVKNNGFKDAFLVSREEYETVTLAAAYEYGDSFAPDDDRPEPIMTMALTFPDLQGSMLKQKAPDIVLRNQQGAAYPLSASKGKTTLVYFWATWSGPARENHTDLNKIHAKYGKSAFDIYGVAFEKDVNRWEKAVQDDQLEWNNHLIDTKGTESSVLEKYKVKYLPAMFLLDENGTVVAENLTYEQLDAELGRRLQK